MNIYDVLTRMPKVQTAKTVPTVISKEIPHIQGLPISRGLLHPRSHAASKVLSAIGLSDIRVSNGALPLADGLF